jgi:hypothetical protein
MERILTFGDLEFITEVALLAIYFDVIMQEFLEPGGIKDLIGSGTRIVDDKLVLVSCLALSSRLRGFGTGLGSGFGSGLGLQSNESVIDDSCHIINDLDSGRDMAN